MDEKLSNPEEAPSPPKRPYHQATAIQRAHEALNFLTRIRKDDPLRKRGMQIVLDWIKANK